MTFFEQLQQPPGNWACEYGGPMFLLPGLVITWYITEQPIKPEYRAEISNYLFARQNKEDWGWGLHIEGQSTVFGTAMNYTTLRLLGQDADDVRMVRARALLHKFGGAIYGPHWAKFWLSVLGVCEWSAVNPVPPELWLLPDFLPISPWRWWIHMRQVFLPMSFIYSRKYQHPLTPLTKALRRELYVQDYASIDFLANRNSISPRDNYHPKSMLLNSINWFLVNVERPLWDKTSGKQKAEDWAYQLVQWEDENTDFACLGPVNAPMNTICCWIREGPESYPFKRHVDRLEDFLWVKSEGMLMNGTNGVQNWDTALLVQAAVEAGVAEQDRWRPMLKRALGFLEDHQISEECRMQNASYRHTRKGAWGFSNKDQGYTVSDCTSEALKAVLMLQSLPGYPQLIGDERLEQAVDVLLTMPNSSGGFGSYEPTRGQAWLMEQLNAAEVFGRIMVEYDYPECTNAVVTALSLFAKLYPDYRARDISQVLNDALDYVRRAQRDDGSWYGSWGICFSYAGMWALESLACAGETYGNSERVRRACQFFLDRQNDDGGWGESYRSCETGVWTPHPDGSQVVQTAWVVISLIEAGFPDNAPIERAVRLLMNRQQRRGEWAQEGIEGVFNKTWYVFVRVCSLNSSPARLLLTLSVSSSMISYPNYKFIFPIKALGMYAVRSGNKSLR